MAENTIRFENSAPGKTAGGGKSIFSGLEKKLKLETFFEEGFPVRYLPRMLFVFVLALIYISNTHYADKATREVNRLQSEVEDLRADYTTLKAEVMYAGKQSEVARRVKALGLEESMAPPFKVVIDKSEY
jgi:cell division protein FtsL